MSRVLALLPADSTAINSRCRLLIHIKLLMLEPNWWVPKLLGWPGKYRRFRYVSIRQNIVDIDSIRYIASSLSVSCLTCDTSWFVSLIANTFVFTLSFAVIQLNSYLYLWRWFNDCLLSLKMNRHVTKCVDIAVYSIQLPDDQTSTYLRALKDAITPDVSMVMCVVPSNRTDRYNAIKVHCCIENPGLCLYYTLHQWKLCALLLCTWNFAYEWLCHIGRITSFILH